MPDLNNIINGTATQTAGNIKNPKITPMVPANEYKYHSSHMNTKIWATQKITVPIFFILYHPFDIVGISNII